MAKNARFYKVPCTSGNDKWICIYPARSQENLEDELEAKRIPYNKGDIECLGWHTVDTGIYQETNDSIGFHSVIDNKSVYIGSNDIGFNHLTEQFSTKYKDVYQQENGYDF